MRGSTTHTGRRVGMMLLAVLVATTTIGATGGIATAKGDASIVVKKPWARTSPMEATNGAVYMVLKNEGKSDGALVSASVPSSVAAETQIHETVMTDGSMGSTEGTMGSTEGTMGSTATTMGSTATTMGGMGQTATSMGGSGTMTMREVEQIDIPAKSTVKLEPGGYHVMLLELAKPLKVGSTVKVTLEFEDGSTQTVKAVVKQ